VSKVENCKKVIELFIGNKIVKVKTDINDIDNTSGGSKPLAWNIQSIKEEHYFDLFSEINKTKQNEAKKDIRKIIGHNKIVNKIERYLKFSLNSKYNILFNGIINEQKFNELNNEKQVKYAIIAGSTMRAIGIAFNAIVNGVSADINIQKKLKLNKDEDEHTTSILTTKDGSRVINTLNLYPAIGRQIAVATGYLVNSDPISNKNFYSQLGRTAVEALAGIKDSDGDPLIKILENTNVINHEYRNLDGEQISSDSTIIADGVTLNLDTFMKNSDKSASKEELNSMLNTGSFGSKAINKYRVFNNTFNASQAINTLTTPVNSQLNITNNYYINTLNKYKEEFAEWNELNEEEKKNTRKPKKPSARFIRQFWTKDLGYSKDGKQGLGVPKTIEKIMTNLSHRVARVNPVIDPLLQFMAEEFNNNQNEEPMVTLNQVYNKLGITDIKLKNAIFGAYNGSISPELKNGTAGKTISKETPLIELLSNYNRYKDGKEYIRELMMFRSTRYLPTATALNEVSDKMSRAIVVGKRYKVERGSAAYFNIIESLVDEFTGSANATEIEQREMIENKGVNKALDALLDIFSSIKNTKLDTKEQALLIAKLLKILAIGKIKVDDKILDIDLKIKNVWEAFGALSGIYDMRTHNSGNNIYTTYRTKPDASASGVVLSLLQALGTDPENDKHIINILVRMQIAKDENRELTEDEIYDDAYAILRHEIEKQHNNKIDGETEETVYEQLMPFVELGLFSSLRDMLKPITMVTNYEAGKDGASKSAANDMAEEVIKSFVKANGSTKDRQKRLDFMLNIIKKQNSEFYKDNNLDEYSTIEGSNSNNEVKLAQIEGFYTVINDYFSDKDNGVTGKMYELLQEAFNPAVSGNKKAIKNMYYKIADVVHKTNKYYGYGNGKFIQYIIPAGSWLAITDSKLDSNGVELNHDHILYGKEHTEDNLKAYAKGTNNYRKWYNSMIRKYGMPITSNRQIMLGYESGNPLLINKEQDNALIPIVSGVHGIDSGILQYAHIKTVAELENRIKILEDKLFVLDPSSKIYNNTESDLKNYKIALNSASSDIYDASHGTAIYNSILEEEYQKATFEVSKRYDIQEQMALLYDSYAINFEDTKDFGSADQIKLKLYDSKEALNYINKTNQKIKTKEELIDKYIINQGFDINYKLFGFNNDMISYNIDKDGVLKNDYRINNKNTKEQNNNTEQSEESLKINKYIQIENNLWTKNIPQDILDENKGLPTGSNNDVSESKKFSNDEISKFMKKHSIELSNAVLSGKPFVVLDIENTFSPDVKNNYIYNYDSSKGGQEKELLQLYAQKYKLNKRTGRLEKIGEPIEMSYKPSNADSYKEILNREKYKEYNVDGIFDGKDYDHNAISNELIVKLGSLTEDKKIPLLAYNGFKSDFNILSSYDGVDKLLSDNFNVMDPRLLANYTLRRSKDKPKTYNKPDGSIIKTKERNQQYVANMLGINSESAHDAKSDVEALAKITSRLSKKMRDQYKNELFKNNKNKNFDKKLNNELDKILKKIYPDINLEYVDSIGDNIKGQADIVNKTVLVNGILTSTDTLPHEYAHHYIAMFRENTLVKEAIKKWGSEEALVQAIGEQVVEQKGKAYGWWKKFSKWVKDLFNNLAKRDKEELKNLITDAFLENKDLGNRSDNTSGSESIKNQYEDEEYGEENTDYTEPKRPKKLATQTLNEQMYYKYKKKNYTVSNYSIIDESLFALNKNISNGIGNIYENTAEPFISNKAKQAHEFMYQNFDIYKMQYDRATKYWESSSWISSIKGYLDPWGRFKNYEDLNKAITATINAASERKQFEDTAIAKMNKLLSKISKEDQKDIYYTFVQAPVFYLIKNNVLSKLINSNNVDSDINTLIKEYEDKISQYNRRSIKRISEFLSGNKEPQDGVAYNLDQLKYNDQEEKDLFGSLLALYTIKENQTSANENINKTGYENAFNLLKNNPKLATTIFDASTGIKSIHDSVYGMTKDQMLEKDNLIYEHYEVPKEFRVVNKKDLLNSVYNKESGWKILIKPESKQYGVVYRDRRDETVQDGAGTTINYLQHDIIVPTNKIIPNAKNSVSLKTNKGKFEKIVLTKEQKEELGLSTSIGDALYRAYGRLMEIEDTQAVRDLMISETMTKYIDTEVDVSEFDKSLKKMKVEDRPLLLSLPKGSIPKEILEDNELIGTYYEVRPKVSRIGQFNEHVDLVRKDFSDIALGYEDPVLFEHNAVLRKSAYAIRQMVKLTKIHWAVTNIPKLIGDVTSNTAILLAYGMPIQDMPKKFQDNIIELKKFEKLRLKQLELEVAKYEGKDVDKQLKIVKDKIAKHSYGMMLQEGMFGSLSIEVMNKDESVISGLQNDIENLLNKFLKKENGKKTALAKAIKTLAQSGPDYLNVENIIAFAGKSAKNFKMLETFGEGLEDAGKRIKTNKKEDIAKYISEFLATPDSALVRFGSSTMQTVDIISRKMLLDTLISQGKSKKEAIQVALESFVDYKINMPKEMKVLSDYGILLFPAFWTRIQKVILATLKANPSGIFFALLMQRFLEEHPETIFDSSLIYKAFGQHLSGSGFEFINGIPPVEIGTFYPAELFG